MANSMWWSSVASQASAVGATSAAGYALEQAHKAERWERSHRTTPAVGARAGVAGPSRARQATKKKLTADDVRPGRWSLKTSTADLVVDLLPDGTLRGGGKTGLAGFNLDVRWTGHWDYDPDERLLAITAQGEFGVPGGGLLDFIVQKANAHVEPEARVIKIKGKMGSFTGTDQVGFSWTVKRTK